MPRLQLVEPNVRTLSDFVATHCPEIKETHRETARHILAKYNGRHPDNPFSRPHESLVIPDNLTQRLLIPAATNSTPTLQLTPPETESLSALLAKYSSEEILSMAEIVDSQPVKTPSKPLPVGCWAPPEAGAKDTSRHYRRITTAWCSGKHTQSKT